MERCGHCGRAHNDDLGVCPHTHESLESPGICGTTLDRYAIESWIGGGGFGAVYKATHTIMGRPVALKVLHGKLRSSPEVLERFFREARAATAVGSPHIVQVFDAGISDKGLPFLAMELIGGCSLADLIEQGPLRPERTIRIALQVLAALGAAHREGIVHRDVKPGNIMLEGTRAEDVSGEDFVKLVDFGISKVHSAEEGELTRTGMTMGSPGYASPEQYMSARNVDARSDVYSVAVLLYRLLSGSLPFEAESYEQMVLHVCTGSPRPLAEVSRDVEPELCAIIDRGVARDPDARWQSAEDMAGALSRFRGSQSLAPPSNVDNTMAMAPTVTPSKRKQAKTPDTSLTYGPPTITEETVLPEARGMAEPGSSEDYQPGVDTLALSPTAKAKAETRDYDAREEPSVPETRFSSPTADVNTPVLAREEAPQVPSRRPVYVVVAMMFVAGLGIAAAITWMSSEGSEPAPGDATAEQNALPDSEQGTEPMADPARSGTDPTAPLDPELGDTPPPEPVGTAPNPETDTTAAEAAPPSEAETGSDRVIRRGSRRSGRRLRRRTTSEASAAGSPTMSAMEFEELEPFDLPPEP